MQKVVCLLSLLLAGTAYYTIVGITFYYTVSTSQECSYNGQYKLIGQSHVTFGLLDISTALLEVCVDGTYYRVCANSTFATIDSVAGYFACSMIGYDCKYISVISSWLVSFLFHI